MKNAMRKFLIEVFGSDTTFRLHEIAREREGAGGLLVLLGVTVLVCDIAYDIIHGVKVIEEKRDRIRFKYGKQVSDIMIEPSFNLMEQSAGIKLSFAF